MHTHSEATANFVRVKPNRPVGANVLLLNALQDKWERREEGLPAGEATG